MTDEDLTEQLLARERTGWEALTTPHGGAHYEAVMTQDAVMIVPGAVLSRDQVRPSLEAVEPWDRYQISDARTVPLGDSAAVLVYTAEADRGEVHYAALMSTTYVRQQDRWTVACHQHTPLPGT